MTATNQNTTAIAKQQPQQNNAALAMRDFLTVRKSALQTYGASNPDRMVQVALLEFSTRDDLRNCSPESIYTALAISAQLGLIPSSALGEAFLVPFKGKCTLIPGWKGFVKLAHRSNAIISLTSDVVYAGDEFRIELGTERKVTHIPALRNRGEIVGAVAIAKLKSGETDVEWIPIEDLERIRKSGANGPAYRDWADQMYRKAPLRRLCKRLPLGDEYARAAAVDELADAGESHRVREVLDVPEQPEDRGQQAPSAQRLAGAVAQRAAAVRGSEPAEQPPDVIDVEPITTEPALEEPTNDPPTPAELVQMFNTCADKETLAYLVGLRAELTPSMALDEDKRVVQDAELAAAKRLAPRQKDQKKP